MTPTKSKRPPSTKARCGDVRCSHLYVVHADGKLCKVSGCPCVEFVKRAPRRKAVVQPTDEQVRLAAKQKHECAICHGTIRLVGTRTEHGSRSTMWVHVDLPAVVHPAHPTKG